MKTNQLPKEELKTIKVPYQGKGYRIFYKTEIIDLSMTPVQFLNVYSVFIEDPVLQEIAGSHFTILHHQTHTVRPCFEIKSSGDIEEQNIKKAIAQQIMNEPGT